MEKKEFINKQRSKTQYNSSAKINLGLKVLRKRSNGYHNISSIFVEIDLLDQLTFTKSSSFTLTSNNSSLSCNSNNTIHQAYQLMKKMTNSNQNFSIYLTKNIILSYHIYLIVKNLLYLAIIFGTLIRNFT